MNSAIHDRTYCNTHEIIIIVHEIRCRIRVSGKPINLRNKNRTATCFCHTILEFAAAEKSLGLYIWPQN
jgi:hypothetical protein